MLQLPIGDIADPATQADPAAPAAPHQEMIMLSNEQRARVRALNDALRQGRGSGRLQVTRGVVELGADAMGEALTAMAAFDAFSPGDDPYGEHDFGAFQLASRQLFFKIDYYDPGFEAAANDPADDATCVRVLTLMLAEEY